MKTWLTFVIVLMLSSFAFSQTAPLIPLLTIEGIAWTEEERAYIRALHQKGSITIATKISSAVYMPQEDGSIRGFHYNVLKEFAELADIAVDIRLVSWSDYFYKEGEDVERVKTDPEYAYVPTLIEQVDLYVDGITALPWREKLFDILKFVPSRQLVVVRKENAPLTIQELHNTRCAMVKDTSMELNLQNIARENTIEVTFLYTENFDAMDKMVADGDADFTVYDSDRAFAACYRYDNLTVAMPVSDIEIMGWAINKERAVLKKVLEKYLKYAQETAILDKYWKQEYGVSFIEYLKILKLK